MTVRVPDGEAADTGARFQSLADQWRAETRVLSNVTHRCQHLAYQQIIGMGETAVPLILHDLQANGPDDWFWALTAITGENPIRPEMAGDMRRMTEAWLEWGIRAGYLSGSRPSANGSSPT
jgi:hypothetical protein